MNKHFVTQTVWQVKPLKVKKNKLYQDFTLVDSSRLQNKAFLEYFYC